MAASNENKSLALYEFKKQVEALKKFRGRGTELVSVYMTPGYPVSDITGKLKEEYGQASNIKSAATKKNVQAALDKIMQYLKTFKATPETGMAVFAGNVSEVEGRPDVELYSVIPPVPIVTQFYRCESQFVLEPLNELVNTTDTYGLVVMDGKEATIAALIGKQIKVIKQIHSTAHSKTHKGGQCLHEKTLIQMADGTIKEIRDVKPGEKVLSYNFRENKFEAATCANVFARTSKESLRIITEKGIALLATKEHLFFCSTDKGIREKYAEDLKQGDELAKSIRVAVNTTTGSSTTSEYAVDKIKSIEPCNEPGSFYDLEVPGNENFVAQGVIAHNSSQRYGRLREEGIEYYQKRIGEAMDSFLGYKNLKGVIVGGPGPAKEDFLKEKTYNYQLKILGMVDTSYTDEYGLREVIDKGSDLMKEHEAVVEKQLVDRFIKEVITNGLATYGYRQVKKTLESGQAERLLLAEDLNLYENKLVCANCNKEKTLMSDEDNDEEECECGGKLKTKESNNLADELQKIAETAGIPIDRVSIDTAEGSTFRGTFGGIGAFLRYK